MLQIFYFRAYRSGLFFANKISQIQIVCAIIIYIGNSVTLFNPCDNSFFPKIRIFLYLQEKSVVNEAIIGHGMSFLACFMVRFGVKNHTNEEG